MCTNTRPDEWTQSLLEAPPASQGRLKKKPWYKLSQGKRALFWVELLKANTVHKYRPNSMVLVWLIILFSFVARYRLLGFLLLYFRNLFFLSYSISLFQASREENWEGDWKIWLWSRLSLTLLITIKLSSKLPLGYLVNWMNVKSDILFNCSIKYIQL